MANNQNTQNAQQTNNQQANNKAAAMAVKKRETIDIVTAKIKEFQNKGELYFPPNYAPENALKSAWLMLQETVDKDDKPALEVCTQASIANALLRMVVLGLNPDKDQCYFIVYGKKLLCQRSYFGSMHIAKTVNPNIADINGKVVYEGDEFEYEIHYGYEKVTTHKQKLSNIHKDKIIAAYGTILYKDGETKSCVMTMDQIKQAWKQSPMKPIDDKGNIKPGTTHDKFTADMCIKTAINKVCKFVINSSDDKSIVARFAREMDKELQEATIETEIAENANKELIDFEDAVEAEYTPAEPTEGKPSNESEDKEKPKTTNEKEPQQMALGEEGPGY